ncbi:hypothetical protein C1Y40_01098 [Mycobacterium talmoniae]|uniref:Uncharacterized protein n=1 Tax=Mycobacterium talmoniae TaxID=1858794 RepID=A0A2S8BQ03_9MYCO|nr:hypothetical protein C1Y40_01098 [Mycobacterium talmoniae]
MSGLLAFKTRESGMPKPLCCSSHLEDKWFIPAALESVRRCPARADYIELCFATDEGSWTWCFRDPLERRERTGGTLALAVGPYGAQAHCVEGSGLGLALPTSEALPMVLGGSRTYVARRLVERGW